MSSPLRRLFHWGPIAVLGIIKLITWSMVNLMGMWWPPHESLGAALHALTFFFLAASTLYYFLQALLEGPGFVPLGWKPENEADTEYLQYCLECNGFKAPRSHHCRKCGYCVKKMDHHCPWINCCVGHNNHYYFTKFLMAAVLGCLHASIVHTLCVYQTISGAWYVRGAGREPLLFFTLNALLLTLLATGMALGVVIAVGALLYFQIRSILRNRTTIEEWILEKAVSRREEAGLPGFVFPYDLGWRRNAALLLRGARLDGLRWPVAAGCGEYDLTMEQKAQKAAKASRARAVVAVRAYGGAWLPPRFPRAALAPPCGDAPRLPLARGDRLLATRARRHWLYGEKLTGAGEGRRGARGWFPEAAVEPLPPTPHPHDAPYPPDSPHTPYTNGPIATDKQKPD